VFYFLKTGEAAHHKNILMKLMMKIFERAIGDH